MKFSNQIPPIYFKCKKAFGVSWDKGVIITYGDTVYSKKPIPDHLEVHEATHVRQQLAMGVELWWQKYFDDKKFRFEQEVEAYRNQLEFIKKNYPRGEYEKAYGFIVDQMVSIYGKMCTKEEAEKALNKWIFLN